MDGNYPGYIGVPGQCIIEPARLVCFSPGRPRKKRWVRILHFIWPEDRVDHIARHHVTPEEVEEVCFGSPMTQRARTQGESPVFYFLGQTESGRYLFCVVIRFPDGKGFPVTARAMTSRERRRYNQWRSR